MVEQEKKMTKEQMEFIPIMEDYHSSDPVKQQTAKNMAIDKLYRYIHSIRATRFSHFADLYEDLIQAGVSAVLSHLEHYDVNMTAPSTYFTPHIIHDMKRAIQDAYGRPEYYNKKASEIKQAAEKIEAHGKQATLYNLSVETGYDIRRIKKTLEIANSANLKYIDDDGETIKLSGKIDGPERQLVQLEEQKAVSEAIKNNLTPEEQKIIYERFFAKDNGVTSFTAIKEKYNYVTTKEVKSKYNSAIKKLKHCREITKEFGERTHQIYSNRKPIAFYKEEPANLERIKAMAQMLLDSDDKDEIEILYDEDGKITYTIDEKKDDEEFDEIIIMQ